MITEEIAQYYQKELLSLVESSGIKLKNLKDNQKNSLLHVFMYGFCRLSQREKSEKKQMQDDKEYL